MVLPDGLGKKKNGVGEIINPVRMIQMAVIAASMPMRGNKAVGPH